jgi:hypothetical protein
MHPITRIETVDESGYLHVQLEKLAGVKVRLIIEDIDNSPNQTPAESMASAKMQEQTGFAKHVLGSAAEDVWNDL